MKPELNWFKKALLANYYSYILFQLVGNLFLLLIASIAIIGVAFEGAYKASRHMLGEIGPDIRDDWRLEGFLRQSYLDHRAIYYDQVEPDEHEEAGV